MDFADDPAQAAFRARVRDWLAGHIPAGWQGEESLPSDATERVEFLRGWQEQLFEGGWLGLSWPVEYGGRGASLVEQAIFQEEMVRSRAPETIGLFGLNMLGPTLIAYGTEAQKQRFLRPILSAEELWCQGFSEPDAGSDLAALRSRAVLDGDEWVVNGHKVWTTLAQCSRWCQLLVRTSDGETKYDGITSLVVDMESPGITVVPIRQINDDHEFNEIYFDDVRVPADAVIGEVGEGFRVALNTLMHERGTLGFTFSARNRLVLDRLVDLVRQGSNGSSPAGDPLVRQELAQLHLEVEAMRLNALRVLSDAAERGGEPGPEGAISKLVWADTNQRMQELALRVLGPDGAYWGDGAPARGAWQWGWLRAKGNAIEGGTTEVLYNVVAERVLGLPKSR